MPQLDVKTIYFLVGLFATTTGAVLSILALTGRFDRWLKYWGISNLCTGAGILLLTFRDIVPDFYSIAVANMLVIIGYFLLMATAQGLHHRNMTWWPHLLFLGLIAGLFLMMQNADSYYNERTALSSVACGYYALRVAKITKQIAREEDIVSAYLVFGIFTLAALVLGMRILASLTYHLGGDSIFSSGGMSMWVILLAASIGPLWNMSMLLMIMERINRNWIGRALRDPLTGALNREGLKRALENNTMRRHSDSHPFTALLLVDIDHFKQVNDQLGHAFGDELLRSFADIVHHQLRSSDLFARQGGDEFVIILPSSGEKEARDVAGRLQNAFAQETDRVKPDGLAVTLSIGIAVTESDQLSGSLHQLMARADSALYQSKHQGRNRITSAQAA
ncbi:MULTISPECIES: GGDEF domain-containing protein [Methylobacillus]|uniref:diguanylate cyclase n=1 Tax=Methylobacillus flagellatus (strain ATCC 51484 / DSM 6875 / VKM B-1610 / KT) TaxID=265072 RepID=Q1H2I9_METFK|nr:MULTISPECIES: GGDEF domain-containing protein [Methylobacillus]ABE49154.1 diguanylate cyclase (GGDEF domain) [Methylobacillus flagellatus KT]ABE49298.1 diguanylate cyclase (GGDEF domain) [Methylobacillus flagellatus KT]MPS49799.1 GGDEF domain-containing protein [Methylobacillus sp.]